MIDPELAHLAQRAVDAAHATRVVPTDPLTLLRALDPEFSVPRSNVELKVAKTRLKQRVACEVERLFLEQLLAENAGNMSATARAARINRTFLYRLLKRHHRLPSDAELE